MSIKKTIYLIIMTLVLCIMTLGYAALQERIDVEVEASIDSTYRVEITRVQEETVVGDARSVQVPSYHNLTSTFNVGLTNDTDYITYTIEVTNYSTVDVILNNTEITTTNDSLYYTKRDMRNGDIILAGGTKTLTLKIKLDTETGSEQTGTITLTLDFARLKGGLGEVQEESYVLPSSYQELEYLESTGTQYINSGMVFPVQVKIDYSFNDNSLNGYKTVIGAQNDQAPFGSGFIRQTTDGTNIQLNCFGSGKTMLFDTDRHIVKIQWYRQGGHLEIDGQNMGTYNPTMEPTSNSIGLFANHDSNRFLQASAAKIYNVQFYDLQDNIIMYLVPCIDSIGVPCMYDTVSGDTFYNQGTGNFLYQLKE